MIMQAPVAICILKGALFYVDIANDRMIELWGNTPSVINKPIFEALPEVSGQGLEQLLEHVYATGEPFTALERAVDLPRNGGMEKVYLNFVYEALKQHDGIINGIMVVAIDVTEQVLAQKRKDDFIGIVSHELKTPLTTLKASLQFVDKLLNTEPENKLEKLIKQCNRSVNKLTYLVEDLLNVTKLNEGQLSFAKENFTLSEIIENCCQHVRMEGKHTILLEGDLKLEVFADANRIEQVIINLVNNAVKYAPGSKNICIKIEQQKDYAKISVTDSGPGIPQEKREHLFNRYYRVDNTGNQISGLGLGLYIANEIVTKHGGKMGVESRIGEGSTFWFTIPL
jgi:signal transduction histidine kinase